MVVVAGRCDAKLMRWVACCVRGQRPAEWVMRDGGG